VAQILVLDDVLDAAIMIRKILERKGHTTHIFDDEDKALRFVDHHPLDLAILDVKLRKMDGIDVLREIKKRNPAVRIIVLTGYPTVDAARRALTMGAYAYCAKPIDKDELETKVAEALGAPLTAMPDNGSTSG
jgi:DNA-binding NtrC family response regulator